MMHLSPLIAECQQANRLWQQRIRKYFPHASSESVAPKVVPDNKEKFESSPLFRSATAAWLHIIVQTDDVLRDREGYALDEVVMTSVLEFMHALFRIVTLSVYQASTSATELDKKVPGLKKFAQNIVPHLEAFMQGIQSTKMLILMQSGILFYYSYSGQALTACPPITELIRLWQRLSQFNAGHISHQDQQWYQLGAHVPKRSPTRYAVEYEKKFSPLFCALYTRNPLCPYHELWLLLLPHDMNDRQWRGFIGVIIFISPLIPLSQQSEGLIRAVFAFRIGLLQQLVDLSNQQVERTMFELYYSCKNVMQWILPLVEGVHISDSLRSLLDHWEAVSTLRLVEQTKAQALDVAESQTVSRVSGAEQAKVVSNDAQVGVVESASSSNSSTCQTSIDQRGRITPRREPSPMRLLINALNATFRDPKCARSAEQLVILDCIGVDLDDAQPERNSPTTSRFS